MDPCENCIDLSPKLTFLLILPSSTRKKTRRFFPSLSPPPSPFVLSRPRIESRPSGLWFAGVSGSQELEIKRSPSRVASGRGKLLVRNQLNISPLFGRAFSYVRNDRFPTFGGILLVHSHSFFSFFLFLSFRFILRGAGPSLIG